MKRIGFLALMILLAGRLVEAQTVSEDVLKPKQSAKEAKVFAKAELNKDLSSKAWLPFSSNLSGTWWRSLENVELFKLTPDQQKKMDDVFQDARVRLIGLDADLRIQEAKLEPLMAAEKVDEAKTLAQVDRVAQARAELEKANARMLLGIRQVLTPEQWTIMQKRQLKTKAATQSIRTK